MDSILWICPSVKVTISPGRTSRISIPPTASTAALYAAAPPLTVGLLVLGAVFATPVKRLFEPFLETNAGRVLSYAGSAALLALCCMRMAAGGFAPFIYFQF